MKSALIDFDAVSITCPKCEEGIVEPSSGSFMWTPWDLRGLDTIKCEDCRTRVKIPQWLKKIAA